MSKSQAAPPRPASAQEEPIRRPRRFRGFSLRTTILTMVVAIIALLATALVFTAWHYSSTNARTLSRRLMNRIAAHVVYRTIHYLKPAETGAALCRKLSRSAVVRAGDPRELEAFFVRLLQVYPQLAMLNYGDEQGNFLMVKRFPVRTTQTGYALIRAKQGVGSPVAAPPFQGSAAEAARRRRALSYVWTDNAGLGPQPRPFVIPRGSLSTKLVRRNGAGAPLVIWKYRDASGALQSVSVTSDVRYDPRVRPWYLQSKRTRRQGWTGVYLFFTDGKPGIASASPILGPRGAFRGAVSVELELYRISEFLRTSRLGKESKVFLVAEDEQVVAYSDVSALRKQVQVKGKPKWVLRNIREVPDGEVMRSFDVLKGKTRHWPPRHRHIFTFDHYDRSWQAMYIPFPAAAGKRWTVGIVVPEDVFLGQIKRNRWMSVFISLLVSFAAILLAVWLSRSISEPLGRLVKETDRIRDLDLRGDVKIESSLQEVDQMASSVGSMKAGLRSFEKYVPRDLVRQLVFSGEEARVEGESREITILFTDIAGFTSIAEGLSPERLVTYLNRYFDEATNVLLAHGATIDKYIGDAIMAFWGAPRETPRHARSACRAALGLWEALDRLNAEWAEAGEPVMRTRIGLHTAEVIVGNIGSDERLAYTIIGDGVNLASRIEGINKQYGTWVLVSKATYDRVSDELVGRVIDIVAVKGRSEGEVLYELRCLRSDEDAASHVKLEQLCEAAFEHYRGRRFAEAARGWREALALLDGEDPATELMLRRCEGYLADPPPDDWTGVHVATTK